MAKNYGKRNSVRRSGSVSKQLLLALVCFLFGYLSASVFDFASLTNWVNTQLQVQRTASTAKNAVAPQAQLPKPKFEFYTLLANERNEAGPQAAPVVVAQATTVAAPVNPLTTKSPPVAVPLGNAVPIKEKELPSQLVAGKDAYLVQVAAFKSKQEAERMKAALSLKGFLVNVAIVNQQKTSWFRVSIGPFASKIQAQQAQIAVARSEHIVGMIRKMDA
jgi:cell division protein FtsN